MSHFDSVCCSHATTKCMYVAQFTDAIAITHTNNNGIFGPGAGQIFLDDVDCTMELVSTTVITVKMQE